MKKAIMILAIVLTSVTMYGQDITGKWNGFFYLHGKQLQVVFNISKTKSGLKATMDSPDKKAYGIPVTYTNFNDSILKLEISNAGIEYIGTFDKDNIFKGTLNIKQSQQLFPMILSKVNVE